jgi:outer membrane protein assembly factor BamB
MNKKKVLLSFVLIIILLTTSCSPQSRILGKWYDEYGTAIEFLKDGTFIVQNSLLSFQGNYNFIDKETLALDAEGIISLFGSQIFNIDFSKGKLFLIVGDTRFTFYDEKPDSLSQIQNNSDAFEYTSDNEDQATSEAISLPSVNWELNHRSDISPLDTYNSELFASWDNSWDIDFITKELSKPHDNFIPVYPKSYAYDDRNIYLTQQDGYPAAYDINDGSELWVSNMDGYVVGCGQETVFVFTNNNRIYGLNKSDGQEKWKIIIDTLISADEECTPFPYFFETNGVYTIPLKYSYQTYNHSIRFLHLNEENGEAELTTYQSDIAGLIEPLMVHQDTLIGIDDDALFSINDSTVKTSSLKTKYTIIKRKVA